MFSPCSATHVPWSPLCAARGVDAETSGQHAIVGRRGAAALRVPQHRGAHVVAGAALDLVADDLANAGKGLVAEFVLLALLELHRPFLRRGALCDADDPVLLPHLEAPLHRFANVRHVERFFRDHRVVRAAGHARVQRDPAHVAAHDLDDEDAVVRLGRGVQPVDGLGSHGDGRVETEGVVRGVDVVIDGLGHPDDRHPVVREPLRPLERALAADRDERVDVRLRQVAPHRVDARFELIRVQPAGAQDRPAPRKDAVDGGVIVQVAALVLHQADPAVLVANDGVAEFVRGGTNH